MNRKFYFYAIFADTKPFYIFIDNEKTSNFSVPFDEQYFCLLPAHISGYYHGQPH